MSAPRPTREQMRQFDCPNCGALAGEQCWRVKTSGRRYRGMAMHAERRDRAIKELGLA